MPWPTLALIRNAGIEPQVILYLETPPSRAQLVQLIADCGLSVREVLRAKGDLYDELGLADPKVVDEPNCWTSWWPTHPDQPPHRRHAQGHGPVPPVREGLDILHQAQQAPFTRRRRSGDRCRRPTPCPEPSAALPRLPRGRGRTARVPTRHVCTRQRLPRTPRAS